MDEIIGKGTWLDSVAARVVEREKKLRRDISMIRTESGLGASGIPHIGSLADAVRAYGITLALRNLGYNSESIAFSDDMDGLRKVPAGMPRWLEDYLLFPVSSVPDPFGCHASYGEHMSGILRDALDRMGIEYRFFSGRKVYESGMMKEQISKVLSKADEVGKIIYDVIGQKKFLNVLPYFPVCKACGRIYTASAYEFDEKRGVVKYKCEGVRIGNRFIKGCNYEGEADIARAEGKLSWKVEFAARWAMLDIRFEAYGKDIADSVKVNDIISDRILGFVPPYHIRYEMFLDESGRKISKSAGNVLTPQDWLKYGTPESLLLLIYKRYAGTRIVSYKSIPKLMDEVNYIEDVYFGRKKASTKTLEMRMKGLYEYIHHLKPPSKPSSHIPYLLIVELACYAPNEHVEDFVISRLQRYGYKLDEKCLSIIKLAINYARDFGKVERRKVSIEITESERKAILELIDKIKSANSAESIQNSIFEVAKSNGIPPPEFFKKLYAIFFGTTEGPRLGPYLFDLGKDATIRILSQYVGNA